MDTVEAPGAAEPQRWTIIFHRKAANRLFSFIALGEFKHVSAFAWIPELRIWLTFDAGFTRTRIVALPDTEYSKAILRSLITGNAIVTMPVREGAMPWFRLGPFCTTAVKHLIGLRSSALRPDALFRHCIAQGGALSDDAVSTKTRGRPDLRDAAGAGAEVADR